MAQAQQVDLALQIVEPQEAEQILDLRVVQLREQDQHLEQVFIQ